MKIEIEIEIVTLGFNDYLSVILNKVRDMVFKIDDSRSEEDNRRLVDVEGSKRVDDNSRSVDIYDSVLHDVNHSAG